MVISGGFCNFVSMIVWKQKYGEKHFYIKLADVNWCRKSDILMTGGYNKAKVLKVYKNTWWRRLLLKMGFKVRLCELKCRPL